MEKSRFDTIAEIWDSHPRRVNIATKTFEAIKEKVQFSENMIVADIGTGTGLLLIHFQEFVKEIEGFDNSQGMVDVFTEKVKKAGIENAKASLFDADKDILPQNKYDLLVSNMTFHHISDISDFMKNAYNSLKQGGKICIADLVSEDGSFHSYSDDTIKHLGFDLSEFKEIMQKVGFKNIEVKEIFSIEKEAHSYPIFLAYGEK